MAVLMMEMLAPSASFVLHTASPLDGDASVLHAEISPGLGETLASGTRGSAWRLAVEKATGKCCTEHGTTRPASALQQVCQSCSAC
jgi:phosphoglucan, water dikinase